MKKYTKLAIAAAALLALNACGGGSDKSTTVTGKLVDAPVAGAGYTCGEVHSTTEADGSFECHTYPVSFSVGGVSLGSIEEVPSDGYVTPQDLLGVTRDTYNAQVQNLAIFLQSLDDDGDIQERVTLNPQSVAKLKEVHADIHTLTHDQIIDLLGKAGVVHIATKEEATKHLQEHLAHLTTDGNHDSDHDNVHNGDHNGNHDTDHETDHDNDHDNVHNGDHNGNHDTDHDHDHDNVHNGDHNGNHDMDHDSDHDSDHDNDHRHI